MRNFKNRFGKFIALIGFVITLLFFASDFSGSPDYRFLFAGVISLWLGIKMSRSSKPPAKKADRFRMMRRNFNREKYYAEQEEEDQDQY
ncbi:MAG: hypothetical protein HON98_04150 [Chloroflexi bacterium]|jgi:hypothetical protein|nr:hypothetical protein [Chloroflexota bacterium]MBT3671271.1 hypothetical protein [Chloroflexota bacterium]MBT4004337.1 hypothetical protein [Chloroflexota bacterium]MBT4304270.1 hypothetical protein [Chloroflexota bacterium]MBT4534289.1 hypothetical protein [Chloroflexota bacterium]